MALEWLHYQDNHDGTTTVTANDELMHIVIPITMEDLFRTVVGMLTMSNLGPILEDITEDCIVIPESPSP